MGGNISTGGTFNFPKCPTPFESVGNFTCVMPCPTERGFERRSASGGFRCVYRDNPLYFTTLNSVSAVPFEGSTLEDLRKKDATVYGEFLKEKDRFNGDIVIVYGKIGKDAKLKDAFQRLQDAENVRDQTPSAYQQARTTYYTLLKGDTWKEEERQRLLKAEVKPIVDSLVKSKNGVMSQYENQRKTIDVVKGLKDKVLSLKGDVKYAADTFKDQLAKVENAINRERRERTATPETSLYTWLDTVLNLTIVGALLYVIYVLYRRMTRSTPRYIPQPYYPRG
jgi:hypothetical protein